MDEKIKTIIKWLENEVKGKKMGFVYNNIWIS